MRLAPSRHLNAVSFWTALQAGLRTGFWQQSGSPAQCSAPQMRPRLSSRAACQHCPPPTAPACTGVQAHFSAFCHTSVLRQRLCDCRGRIQHCRADDYTLHHPSRIASPECRTACQPWEAVLHSALSGTPHLSHERRAGCGDLVEYAWQEMLTWRESVQRSCVGYRPRIRETPWSLPSHRKRSPHQLPVPAAQ